jgi:hypothetical protein
MQVFNKYIMPATIETLAQMVKKFNAASGGAIRLTTEGFTGDFLQESFFASIQSARRRVDRYASNTDAPVTDLSELKHSTVKVAGGFGPIRFEPGQLTWLERPTQQGVEVASRNFAEALMQDQLNTAIMVLVAAIEANSALVNDVSTGSPALPVSYSAMNGAHAKFGDHSGSIVADVMTGAVAHRLIGQNIANLEGLFDAKSVRIIELLGKVAIITDAPALFEAVSGDDDLEKVLSLVDGAAIIHDAGDVISNVETSNGKQRIETTVQVDYTFGVGVKGYTWNETAGGKSPTDEDLATGSNWVKVASSNKHTAGVLTVGSADV